MPEVSCLQHSITWILVNTYFPEIKKSLSMYMDVTTSLVPKSMKSPLWMRQLGAWAARDIS